MTGRAEVPSNKSSFDSKVKSELVGIKRKLKRTEKQDSTLEIVSKICKHELLTS